MSSENAAQSTTKPVVLLILDGFGVAPDSEGNAITRAKTPVYSDLIRRYPTVSVRASGEEVGLSWGEMGNSEVGHLAIGSGRVYYQSLPRINLSIKTGEFFQNEAFVKITETVKKTGGTLHLIGLVSNGRVHSLDEHCHALLKLAKDAGIKKVAVHVILDGRDTVYNAGIDFLNTLQTTIKDLGVGFVASVSGRYYAMDRDHRWDREQKAYEAMVLGRGQETSDPVETVRESYSHDVFDEELVPTVVIENGKAKGPIVSGDGVIFFNFRPDRMRQMVQAFVDPSFDGFSRELLVDVPVVTMAEYDPTFNVSVAFPPVVISNTLAEVISQAGLSQLHVAETEKYAHVTFFLNGTREQPFPLEERVLIPSPSVSSYDQTPDMRSLDVAKRVVEAVEKKTHDFIVANLANPDMVAHTGNLQASIQAIEATDKAVGMVVQATLKAGGVVCITADHGNAEELLNLRTNEIDKEHATNPVPFLIIGRAFEGKPGLSGEVIEGDLSLLPPVGVLADVAPTILEIMGLPKPVEMTGQSLLPPT